MDKYLNYAVSNSKETQLKNLEELYKNKSFDELIKFSKAFIKKFSGNSLIYNILGIAYYNLEKFEVAINFYDRSITINPNYVDPYNNKALALKKIGNSNEAITQYKKVLNLNPKFTDTYKNLGNLFWELELYDDAESIWLKGLKVNPKDINLLTNLSSALEKKGEILNAKKQLNEVLKINPGYILAINNLGVILQAEGKFDEAKKLFVKAIKINPQFTDAYFNLSSITKFKKIDNIVKAMKKIHKKPDISKKDKINICFSLAKFFDDVKEYSQAYKYLSEGNSLKKETLKYNFIHDKNLFRKVTNKFDNLNIKNLSVREPESFLDKSPIFILGMPRSGTSLIEQIVSSHSKIHGAGELGILPNSIYKSNILNRNVTKNFIDDLREKYLAYIHSLDTSKPLIVDKMPSNFLWIGFIYLIIPNVKIVHIKRNPMATCWSIFSKNFTNNKIGFAYNLDDISKFYKMYIKFMDYWNMKFPNKIYNLDYEKLTENQDYEIKKLITFLNVRWEDNCLKSHKNFRSIKTASSFQVRQKIYKGSSEKWMHYSQYLQKTYNELKPYLH